MFTKIMKLVLCVAFIMLPVRAFALPTGGEISAGTGNIPDVNPGDTSMTITQTSDRMIADFDTFNIAQPETVTFDQHLTSDIALNRIHDVNPSQILGTLSANGRVFLINPNGVVFGQGCTVDTSGLIASTLDIENGDFMDGNNNFYFSRGEIAGLVQNAGTLTNHTGVGGFIGLLGPRVENTSTGVISLVNSVVLASGDALCVSLDAGDIIRVSIDENATVPAVTSAGVINAGEIHAGSTVLLTAQVLGSLFDNAINNSGIVEAKEIEIAGDGNIALSAGIAGNGVRATNWVDEAKVLIESTGGDVSITGTEVKASIIDEDADDDGDGNARIDILAGAYDSVVTVDGESKVIAEVAYDGEAIVNIMAGDHYWSDNGCGTRQESLTGGEVSILGNSLVKAAVGLNGEACTWVRAGGFGGSIPNTITINDSTVGSYVNNGWAEVLLRDGNFNWYENSGTNSYEESESLNGGHVDLNRSVVEAMVKDSQGDKSGSEVEILAGVVTVNDTDVTASVTGPGDTEVNIEGIEYYSRGYGYEDFDGWYDWEYENGSNGVIDIIGGSNILATTNAGDAEVFLQTGPWVDSGGSATYVNIDASTVISDVNGLGHAGVYIGTDITEIDWVEDIAELVGYDIGDLSGGPIYGPITVTNSKIHAESEGPEADDIGFDTAVIGMATQDDLTITDSEVSVSDLETAAIALYSEEGDIAITGSSTVSAASNGIAAVVAMAGDTINAPAAISADGGEGNGIVALLSWCDLFAGNVSAKGSNDVMPYLDDLVSWYLMDLYAEASADFQPQFGYGNAVVLASLEGDITLGDISADAVVAAALGMYSPDIEAIAVIDDGNSPEAFGSIFDIGDVNAHLFLALAAGDIGTAAAPIQTDVDILGAYSFCAGNIFINEANKLEVGVNLPVVLYDSEGDTMEAFLGIAVAANDGTVNIRSAGDMLVNSILAPRGGVFLESTAGSIYAGQGWYPADYFDLLDDYFQLGDIHTLWDMDLYDTPWYDQFGTEYFSPIVLTVPDFGSQLFNVVAGGASYFSVADAGQTIGVGTADAKDPAMSGGIFGVVEPATTAVTGVEPAPGFDLTPSGYVLYGEEGWDGQGQIWPEALGEGLTFENPLTAAIIAFEGYPSAVPEGFVPAAALTLSFGNRVVPPVPPGPTNAEELFANAFQRDLRLYYELMAAYRFVSNEPATPTSFFGYRPLRDADMTAFDEIMLDEEAYDFISDNLKLKKKVPVYFE